MALVNRNFLEIEEQVASIPAASGRLRLFVKSSDPTNLYAVTAGGGESQVGLGGSGISNVVEDTTPQLGGNLDVNGKTINSVSNGAIRILPNGTGKIEFFASAASGLSYSPGTSVLEYNTNDNDFEIKCSENLIIRVGIQNASGAALNLIGNGSQDATLAMESNTILIGASSRPEYTVPTGTQSRAGYDADSPSLAEVAETLAAVVNDLTNLHSLFVAGGA